MPLGAQAAQESYRAMADKYFNVGKLTPALEFSNLDVKHNPSNWEALLSRGRILNRLDRSKEALADLKKAFKLNPNNADIHRWLGDTYSDMEQYQKGVDEFDIAIRLSRECESSTFGKRAHCLHALGRTKEALAGFDDAIKCALTHNKKPYIRECYMWRGQLLYNEKQYAKAAEDFTKAINVMPDKVSDQLIMLRANSYERLGKPELAIADYSVLIKANPKDDSAYEKRSKLYVAAGHLDKALSDANKAIDLYPGENPARLYRLRADIHKRSGHASLAAKDLALAKKYDSDTSF